MWILSSWPRAKLVLLMIEPWYTPQAGMQEPISTLTRTSVSQGSSRKRSSKTAGGPKVPWWARVSTLRFLILLLWVLNTIILSFLILVLAIILGAAAAWVR